MLLKSLHTDGFIFTRNWITKKLLGWSSNSCMHIFLRIQNSLEKILFIYSIPNDLNILYSFAFNWYSIRNLVYETNSDLFSRHQLITCIFKSGDPHYYNNYRVISILSAFSKIIEKAATERLLEYFLDKNLLSEFQFGYKPNVSTVDALLSFVDDIYTAFDGGECAIGVFLDLSKAFDSLNRYMEGKYTECPNPQIRGENRQSGLTD